MPMHAYFAVAAVNNGRASTEQQMSQPLDAADFSASLRGKKFQARVLLAANAGNGFYGSGSSNALSCNAFEFAETKFLDQAAFFDPGGTISAVGRQAMRASLGRTDSQLGFENQVSGGCPVRYASYPELGPMARRYAELAGRTIEELQNPSQSAIVASCELLANCMDRLSTEG
ncbi:MAG: hypothetical protein ACREGA_01130 [Candidatus Saccharimonadales bacterium]